MLEVSKNFKKKGGGSRTAQGEMRDGSKVEV